MSADMNGSLPIPCAEMGSAQQPIGRLVVGHPDHCPLQKWNGLLDLAVMKRNLATPPKRPPLLRAEFLGFANRPFGLRELAAENERFRTALLLRQQLLSRRFFGSDPFLAVPP